MMLLSYAPLGQYRDEPCFLVLRLGPGPLLRVVPALPKSATVARPLAAHPGYSRHCRGYGNA